MEGDEHGALREAVRGLLDKDPAGHWARLCGEIGAAGLAIPERYGGVGAGLLECHVVLKELGRALLASPLLGSAILAGQAVLRCGDETARARLLPGIAAGTRIAALAWADVAGRWDAAGVACTADDVGVLRGTAHYVLDGDTADTLLAFACGPDGIALYEVDTSDPAVVRTPVTALDLTRRLAVVELHDARGQRLGGPCALDGLRDIACAALSAEQVGAAGRALELTVDYTKTRVQFGQPIGAFQGLQHRLADLHVLVGGARSASWAAAAALVEDSPDAPELAAVAKVHCSETLERVASEMIQLHGGIGITWEHDAHRFFKRAHGAAHLFGHPSEHVARLAGLVVDDQPLTSAGTG